jgi:hypothetical protein
MKIPRLLPVALLSSLLACAHAENPNTQREIEKAAKETFPRASRAIEENVDAKVALGVDAASFGDDEKAWSNLYIIANRIVGALGEVGKDQVGKDAIAKGIQKVVIVKIGTDAKEDSIDLKDGTLTVKTTGTDPAMALLQGIITRSLEKTLLGIAPTAEKTP